MSISINNQSGGIINVIHGANVSIRQANGQQSIQVCDDIPVVTPVPVQEDTPQRREYCLYICPEKLKEQGIYTIDEFESMMANASKEPAIQFAKFLDRFRKQGILNFMGHTKRQIFDNLRAHYPEMRDYSYPNFAAAY